MTGFATGYAGLPHGVFLKRLADGSEPGLEPRLGRAAFLVLRLVDLLAPEHAGLHPDAFRYQHIATERCCRDLPPGSTEAKHLLGLVQDTDKAFRQNDLTLVLPALFAYAHFLEDELLLEEALDVLDEALYVSGDKLRAEDGIALRLRRARVLRKLNAFDAAERAYVEGGTMAAAIGDTHSDLLSRIGRIGPMVWYMPANANLAFRELGIVLFLACVGIKAGEHFFEKVFTHEGLLWLTGGFAITVLPLLIVGIVARALMKLNFTAISGLLAGSMTDPPALAFANAVCKSDAPSVAYATVYPLTMLLRIVSVQMLVLVLCR